MQKKEKTTLLALQIFRTQKSDVIDHWKKVAERNNTISKIINDKRVFVIIVIIKRIKTVTKVQKYNYNHNHNDMLWVYPRHRRHNSVCLFF